MKKPILALFVGLLAVGSIGAYYLSIWFFNDSTRPQVETCQTTCATTIFDGYVFESDPPQILISTESDRYFRLEQGNRILRSQAMPSPDDFRLDKYARGPEGVLGPWQVSFPEYEFGSMTLIYGGATPVELTITMSDYDVSTLVVASAAFGIFFLLMYGMAAFLGCLKLEAKLFITHQPQQEERHGLQT